MTKKISELTALGAQPADTDKFIVTDADDLTESKSVTYAQLKQTGAQIKAAYEAEADTNAYDDAAVAKLAGIEAGATADQTAGEIEAIVNHDNLVGFVASEHYPALDEDDMSSDSAVNTATQQSIKAYHDSGTATLTNKTLNDFSNDVHCDDVHLLCRNVTGVTINKGKAVYISGFNVGNDQPEISLADASVAGTMPAVGITAEDINNNAAGEVILFGIVSGLDTSAFNAGDILFVSETAGELTTTKPTGSALVQEVGEVIKSNASTGKIDVVNEPVPYVTGFAATLLDDGDAGTARTTLGALGNVVEDTTPQLGGALDVNGQEITGAIDLHSTGDIIQELGDAAGTNKVSIRDSAAVEVAAIDSDGNISTAGTVDGRDIAADGTKLDGIEANATADQTGAEIKTAYEAEANTNAFTDAEQTKLSGIEASADVTDATNVASAGAVMADGTGNDITGDLVFTEKADHSSTPGAGKGYVWVKNTAPSTLIFTDDSGADTTLGSGGGGGTDVSVIDVEKASAGTINKGQVVYVAGYDGVDGRPTVELADADNASAIPPVGVANESIDNSTGGDIVVNGIVSGFNTSSFTAGNYVYLDTTVGGLTETRPDQEWVWRIGQVLYSHASSGILQVHLEKVRGYDWYEVPTRCPGTSTSTENTRGAIPVSGTVRAIQWNPSNGVFSSDSSNKWTVQFQNVDNSNADLLAAAYDTNTDGNITAYVNNDMGTVHGTAANLEVSLGDRINRVWTVTGSPTNQFFGAATLRLKIRPTN